MLSQPLKQDCWLETILLEHKDVTKDNPVTPSEEANIIRDVCLEKEANVKSFVPSPIVTNLVQSFKFGESAILPWPYSKCSPSSNNMPFQEPRGKSIKDQSTKLD